MEFSRLCSTSQYYRHNIFLGFYSDVQPPCLCLVRLVFTFTLTAAAVIRYISPTSTPSIMMDFQHSHHASLLAALLVVCGIRAASITHGVMVGDVSWGKATVWSRANEESTMLVSIYECCDLGRIEKIACGEVDVDESTDYTGRVDISGLLPDTCYKAYVAFETANINSLSCSWAVGDEDKAKFTTAPPPSVAKQITFAWGGDVAGQNVCRDLNDGFPIFKAINTIEDLDFFVHAGDAIYADNLCEVIGTAGNSQVEGLFNYSATLEDYNAHWKYILEDASYQTLVSGQAFFMTWDDHEVVNDFGPDNDERETPPYTAGESLLPLGLEAFLNYNPIRNTVDTSDPTVFYRTVRWGKMMEMFILDTRQYRSLATLNDTEANNKTMLGETQLAWLKDALTVSDATWKFIVSSVPISIPTGASDLMRDGWANYNGQTGYESELSEIFEFMANSGIDNVIFISADVHFAEVFKYTPCALYPDWNVYEFVVGPMNAGLFPNTEFDKTFHPEVLFFYGPEDGNSFEALYSWNETIPWFNFGKAEIARNGTLKVSIINALNEVLYTLSLDPK